MKRRNLLKLMGGGVAALTTVSYFDMGASWAKHGDVWILSEDTDPWCPKDQVFLVDAKAILKEYYNDRTVASLTYQGDPFSALGSP
jgi:hypothetical protein